MSTQQREAIRQAIVEYLEGAHEKEASFPDLLEGLRNNHGLTSEGAIKMVVWPLISESVLELTDQRKLKLLSRA